MYNFLEQYAQGKYILIGLLLITIINVIIFPFFSEFVSSVSVPIQIILDINPFYTPEIANDLMDDLGELGRKSYFSSTFFVDTPYALIYTFTYMITVLYLLQKNEWTNKYWLVLVPFGIGLLDIFENSGILFLISNYPNHYDDLVTIMSMFTLFKWVFAVLTFITLLVLTSRYLWRKYS